MAFYNSMRDKYGNKFCSTLKQHRKLSTIRVKTTTSKNFLLSCRKLGLTPNFITNTTTHLEELFQQDIGKKHSLLKSLQKTIFNFHCKILNLFISAKHKKLTSTVKIIQNIESSIVSTLTEEEYINFLFHEQTQTNNRKEKLERTHDKKLTSLKDRMKEKYGIRLNQKWFVNKTSVPIPDEIQYLLSLGPKYALPSTIHSTSNSFFKIIADGEDCIQTINDNDEKEKARGKFANMLNNCMEKRKFSEFNKYITNILNETKRFLYKHREIYIVSADKGNVTVAIYKHDYDTKMKTMMEDRNVYWPIRNDPTNKLQEKNNSFVKYLFENQIIDQRQKQIMTTYNSVAPRLYGLPKIHKEGLPLRPICSSTKVPCYNLAKYLISILKNLTSESKFNVKDSLQFKNKLHGLKTENDEVLVSFDVISLFTNIPLKMALELISKNWGKIKEHTLIKKPKFLELLRFCIIDNNYLVYGNKTYQQKDGMPMGNPASPIIADIILEELLNNCLEKLPTKPKVLTKYVDDIFAIIKAKDVEQTLSTLNSFHRKIQFTVEIETNNQLAYLDTVVIRKEGILKMDWFQKSTSSGRLINFFSQHPKQIIFNTAKNLIHRVLSISDTEYHINNKIKIKDILQKNAFPQQIIKTLITQYEHRTIHPPEEKEKENKFHKSFTYIKEIADRFKNAKLLDTEKYKLAMKSTNTTSQLYTNLKTKIDKMEHSNLIYKINCNGNSDEDCNQIYIGTTKQKLKSRLAGHKSDIKSNALQKTALASHCITSKHSPNYDNVKIMQREEHQNKRMIIETLHIINADKAMNRRTDMEDVSPHYKHLVEKRKRKSSAI